MRQLNLVETKQFLHKVQEEKAKPASKMFQYHHRLSRHWEGNIISRIR